MKNTLENKAKFFAQYWGQTVVNWNNNLQIKLKLNVLLNEIDEMDILELKPISSITKEDACIIAMLLVDWQESMSKLSPENIEVRGRIDGDHVWDELVMNFKGSFSYVVRYRGGDFLTWIDSNGRCEWNTSNHLQVYDYLRSKGYALPWIGLSVEQLEEYGWIKIKK